MSRGTKLSKAQLCKTIQSGGLASVILASAIDGAIEREIGRRGVVKTGKRIILVIFYEDMDNIIIKIIKSLGKSGVLIHGVS